MDSNQTVNLYVTYVEKEGPFLKIWGQTERTDAIYVDQFLTGISQHLDAGVGKIPPESLQPGLLVCAKYKDNKYHRVRIINCIHDIYVEVNFVDYGYKDVVSCENIRTLQNLPSSFISIPPLAVGFIFAEAHCVGGGVWDDIVFNIICKEIGYREVQCQLLIQAIQFYLVKVYLDGRDLHSLLTQRSLMQPITLQAQQAVLLSMNMQKQVVQQQVPQTPAPSNTINTYKACTLEPGCQYQVYVSYVNDGPYQFSVQLKQTEDVLAKLMSDINSLSLKLLEDVPIPGTICLAKCQEDGSVCRAVVTNEVDYQFKVFYVDFGNYEIVPISALYQIPFKYVIPKVMAIRYALNGVDKSTLTMDMRMAFKTFVDNRLLHMKVLPTPTRMAIPKCELWDPETQINALDVVSRAAVNAYPEPITLVRGFSQSVKVSYVYSCNRFCVQLSDKQTELENFMKELQVVCTSTEETLDPSVFTENLPCCALFEDDNLWYRSEIVAVLGDRVKVKYIDFGNEEEIQNSQLKRIGGEQMTALRPQAIECCLNGYQNMEDDAERNTLLENIILEDTFMMKVVDIVDKKALVELYNASNYNVASLLLEKIAALKSQVSPILVQAGNKIEHRKSPKDWQNTSGEQNFRGSREQSAGRETYSRNERSNDRNEKSWRQNNRENRNPDNSFDGNENNSWRQNNKGFSPTHRRPNSRENDQKTDNWNNTASNSWGETSPTKKWSNPNSATSNTLVNKEWDTSTNDGGHKNDRRTNDYGRNKGGFNKDSRANLFGGNRKEESPRRTPDSGGGGSDSGSDKGYRKGPRTSSRNDRGRDRQFGSKPVRKSPFDEGNVAEDSWNVSAVTVPIDAAPTSAVFLPCQVVGTEAKVTISWFHNPGLFYCQLVDFQDQFRAMVEEIQQFYKNRKPESSVPGAPVIGLFPEDKVLYRAQVLEVIGDQYKVFYVDFGNVSTITKVWPIEKRFMTLPAQAVECGLHDVKAAQGNWGEPDVYGAYFDKDSFLCKFVDRVDDKTLVDILHDSEDIAQQLVRDGLAVSTQSVRPTIDIPMLLGQQLRVTLMSINSFEDIIVVLECGLAVSCAVHNYTYATETFENTLKGLLQQTVIIYVDNVIQDKLEVTFYDTQGMKHVLINPDEGAYEVIDRLCPMPVLRATFTGYVSFADASSVFVQPAEYADMLAYLLNLMFETYENKAPDEIVVPLEEQIYAVHSEDGNWYRGRVTSFDDEKASVNYVDYGNSENVSFAAIRELDDKFFDICTQSLQITVAESESFLDKDVSVTVELGTHGWEGSLVVLETDIIETGENQAGSVDTGFATSSLDKPESESILTENDWSRVVRNEPASVVSSEVQNYPVTGQAVYASHVDSPNEFYLQFTESLKAIDDLQAELQEHIEDMPVLESPAVGMFCAAPYSLDQQWYRAEILDADADITTVRFVDFGNTDVIDNATTRIRTLSSKLLSLALYATRCSLKVVPKDEEWSAAALELFEQLATADNLSVELLDQNEKTSYVELYSDGVNVREGLLSQNFARPMAESSKHPRPTTGFVSHLNSPSEFWMQLETCVDELEWIAEQLNAAETFPELEDLTPGTLCAALFPDDQMWYRARILSNTVAGVELLFIDCGNSSSSASLRQLPEDLVATAPLAQKCSLRRPDGVAVWTPEACAKFAEIAKDGQTVFVVKRIAADETSTVQLLLNDVDVAEMLLPVTEDGYVKEAETLQNLQIKKASGESVDGKLALEPLPGQDLNEDAIKKFEEINEQGSTLFQIEFVNENTVRLYLNGQDIRPLLGGTLETSFEISQIENDTHNECTHDGQEVNVALPEVNEIVREIETEISKTHMDEGTLTTLEQPESLKEANVEPIILVESAYDIKDISIPSSAEIDQDRELEEERSETKDILMDYEKQYLNISDDKTSSAISEDLASNVQISNPEESLEDSVLLGNNTSAECPSKENSRNVFSNLDTSQSAHESERSNEDRESCQSQTDGEQVLSEELPIIKPQNFLLKTIEHIPVYDSSSPIEIIMAVDFKHTPTVNEEIERIESEESELEKIDCQKSPVSTQKSNSSEVTTPKKSVKQSLSTNASPKKDSPINLSPVKISPKKESPVKVTPKRDSPIKVSSLSPVKVSPKKDSTVRSPTKKSPVKLSTKEQATVKEIVSNKTSPVEEEANEKNSLKKITEFSKESDVSTATISDSEKTMPTCNTSATLSEELTKSDDNDLKADVDSKAESLCSQEINLDERIDHDENIVPACISRSDTPNEECMEVETSIKTSEVMRPQSSCSGKSTVDESNISRQEGKVESDSEEKSMTGDRREKENDEEEHRPDSANSGKIKYDDKILSAAVIGLTSDDENTDVGVSE